MLKNVEKYNVPLLFALIVLNLLDFVTTYICISMGGNEANPLLSYLMELYGTIWVILYTKLVIISVLIPFFSIASYYPELIERHVRPGFTTFVAYLLMAVNAMYVYVVVNNLYIISILSNYQ